jgi:transglutaminase-like putative cysteine protease
MSGVAATLGLRRPSRRESPAGASVRAAAAPPPASVILRLIAFAALAAYAASSWLNLVAAPPRGRAALAVLAVVAGGAALAWLGKRLPRSAAAGAGAGVAILAIAAGAVAIGLPARLLAPANWAELGGDLGRGFEGLGGLTYPYRGGDWPRLTILLGLPAALGLAAALAFWPSRRAAPLLRALALVAILVTYGVGATVSPPGAPLLHGLVLLLLVAAWLWLPGLGRREALASGALVLAAGLLALPVTARLDGHHPWLDYRNWNWSWSSAAGTESFNWDQSYGPLDWTRTGETLLQVKSDAPHYWRTVVLDQFDGYRWLQATASATAAVELPRSSNGSPFTPQTVRLNLDWVHELTFHIRHLSSQLVVGAGTPLGVQGLDGVASIQGGLALPPGHGLGDGDSYTLRAFIPDPSAGQMRHSPRAYPHVLAPYTLVELPRSRTIDPGGPGSLNQHASSSTQVTLRQLTVPFWGATDAAADRALSTSAYGGVYHLTRRITTGARTPYDAVRRLESYLRSSYTYSETPPQRNLPLRAFLLRDGVGYCQQFSGAMALMLRMVGIPARVVSGFSPGSSNRPGEYVVSDFDAHSWVEVYFNGIGWVPFDPTPAAAPAQSQSTGLGGHAPGLPRTVRPLPAQRGDNLTLRRGGEPGTPAATASHLWLVPLLAVGLLALAGLSALGIRALRNRSLSGAEMADAQLRELRAALGRLRPLAGRGSTLLALERRLGVVAGPASRAYVARLRATRYQPGPQRPPTPAERRALRRELVAGLGLRGRLRGLVAIPPGGPAAARGTTA